MADAEDGEGIEHRVQGATWTVLGVALVLVLIGLLWLVPTLGLFFTSLLEPAAIGPTGWWEVISTLI